MVFSGGFKALRLIAALLLIWQCATRAPAQTTTQPAAVWVNVTQNVGGGQWGYAGVTTMGAGRTVSVSINGAAAAASTTTASNGTFTVSGLDISNVRIGEQLLRGIQSLLRSLHVRFRGDHLFRDRCG